MRDTTTSIGIYEINGNETNLADRIRLEVTNHWNRKNFVLLKLMDGTTIAVKAEDLRAAVTNATNYGIGE